MTIGKILHQGCITGLCNSQLITSKPTEGFSHWGIFWFPVNSEGQTFTLQNPRPVDWLLFPSMSPQVIVRLMRPRISWEPLEKALDYWDYHVAVDPISSCAHPVCRIGPIPDQISSLTLLHPGQRFHPTHQLIQLRLIFCLYFASPVLQRWILTQSFHLWGKAHPST